MTPTAPVPTPPLLHKIRWNVYRLTITTHPPLDALAAVNPNRRKLVTREPLLTQLRDGIRPNQGGTDSGRGGGSHSPLDTAALELYEDITGQIAGVYLAATDRTPAGTPEQLLLEWFREFEYAHREGTLTDRQLENFHEKISRWRYRIEDHFTPPTHREYPLCPSCGYTHRLVDIAGEIIQQRCVLVTWWPGNPRRDPITICRQCDAEWIGVEGLERIHAEIDQHIAHYGPTITAVAPIPTDEPDALEVLVNGPNPEKRSQS